MFSQLDMGSLIADMKEKIKKGNLNDVISLIEEATQKRYDLNFNDPKSKYTLLHFCITKTTEKNELDILKIIKSLQKTGCDINKAATDRLQNTPIHTACRRALPIIVKWLLENGADQFVRDKNNKTAIDYVNSALELQDNDVIIKRLSAIQGILQNPPKAQQNYQCNLL